MDNEDKLVILEDTIENIIFGSEISYHEYKLLNFKQEEIKQKKHNLLFEEKIYIQFYNYKGKPVLTFDQKEFHKNQSTKNGKNKEAHNKSFYDDFRMSEIMVNKHDGKILAKSFNPKPVKGVREFSFLN